MRTDWRQGSHLHSCLRHKEDHVLPLFVVAPSVYNFNLQAFVLIDDSNLVNLDAVPEPVLQRALNQELRGAGKCIAVGHEEQLPDPASKIRTIDSLAGSREQDFVNHVAHMLVEKRQCRTA